MASNIDPSQMGLYEILGVSVGATNQEIHKAYKKKAREYHPDKTGTDESEELMKRLNKAKETLLSEKRTEYDEKMEDEEGEGTFDPAGFLPEGQRLSLIFLQYFNNYKISFEAGFIRNVQNFQTLLQNELHRETKAPPALPFAEHTPRRNTKAVVKIQSHASPLDEVMDVTNSALADSELNVAVESQQRQLQRILEMTKDSGTRSSLPPRENLVPILELSGVPDSSLQFLHSIFIESDEEMVLGRDKMLSDLSSFVPYVNVEQCSDVTSPKKCGSCNRKFNFFNKPNQTCYRCKSQFCKSCPIKQIKALPRLRIKSSETLCSKCLQQISNVDAEDWTKSSVDLIKVGTTGSVKAAMGCLTVALCLSNSNTKPIIRVAQGFFHHGLPELAIPFVSTVLQNSKDSREILGMYVLGAQIFKAMADQATSDQELQWNFLLAAKDCCNLALQEVSSMDSSVEVPNLTSVNRDITASLHLIREQQEQMHEREIQLQCVQLEALWQRRDYKNLLAQILTSDEEEGASNTITLSFLPRQESLDVLVLEHFLAPKEGFLDRMCPDDRCALIFFRGILKMRKGRISEGLADIEETAYESHHHEWLKNAVANVLIGLVIDDPVALFSPDSFKKLSTGRRLLSNDVFDNRFDSLFPKKHEVTPPFTRNWPELTVTGLNTRGHLKFEKAVLVQVDKGAWSEWDVAMAYIDYVPGCGHPAELALCFLNAAMWLLKHLIKTVSTSTSSRVPRSEIYATKGLIVKCLQNSLTMAYLRLHPGMQLYISRLCLGTLLETMRHAAKYATQTDTDLATSLLHLMMYTCRFNPVWRFPSVPISEAVLMNIKTGRFHQDFLLDLQEVDEKKWPMTRPELLYQLYENDLRYICKLEDSAGIRSKAMEEMLSEKGWTWNDVTNIMTSPLSPRDRDDGFLIQQPYFGVSMEFAELKGFSFNLDSDNPSIEVIAVPADRSRGRLGLFSMEDVQTVLQLEIGGLIFFSLDSPNDKQRFHPFQQFRYGDEKLHKTPWLHTLFETDYLLKSFSVGSEVSAKPPFNQRPCEKGLTKNLPPHLQEAVKPVSKRGSTTSNIHRFWIQAGELVYDQKQVGSKLTINLGNLKMSVRSHPLLPGPDGKLEDTEDQEDPDSPEAKFAADLTAHYNELGLHFPMFARLRELAKLQVLGIILSSVMEDLRERANGVGVEVPRRLLTEIQQDARQRQQGKIQEVIRNLNQEVGVWPAAEDYNEVSSLVQTMISQLPYHIQSQASYSDIRPYAEEALRTKDSSVLSQVVDGLMQLCERRLSRGSLESSVRQWLSSRSSTATSHLIDLICSALPLPTNEDIKRQMIEVHSQKYRAFKQKVNSVTSPLPKVARNPCKWVPAALLKEETTDTMSMCYGGVLLYVRLKSGNVSVSSRAQPVRVQRSGARLGQYQSNSKNFHAPQRRFKPADATESGGEGGRSNRPIHTGHPPSTSTKPRKADKSPASVIGNVFQSNSSSSAKSAGSRKSSPLSAPALASKAIAGGTSVTNAKSKIRAAKQKKSKNRRGGNKGPPTPPSSDDEDSKKGKRRRQEKPEDEMLQIQAEKWEQIKKEAKKTGNAYRNEKSGWGRREYYFTKLEHTGDKMIAVSKDTAHHGQAIFKAFRITGTELVFMYSLDPNMKPMRDKCESNKGLIIKRNTLKRIRIQ